MKDQLQELRELCAQKPSCLGHVERNLRLLPDVCFSFAPPFDNRDVLFFWQGLALVSRANPRKDEFRDSEHLQSVRTGRWQKKS